LPGGTPSHRTWRLRQDPGVLCRREDRRLRRLSTVCGLSPGALRAMEGRPPAARSPGAPSPRAPIARTLNVCRHIDPRRRLVRRHTR
jgi:hypothetical protein